MTDPFLPEGYNIPSSGGRYFKLLPGENQVRILDSPVMGNEFWTEAGGKRMPVRRRTGEPITADESGGEVKHFWAMPVWSYRDRSVMVWEVTQKGILKTIKDLAANPNWGNPRGYDLVVGKSGSGMETEYSVVPVPPKPLPDDAQEAWDATDIDLTALFRGEDPFAAGTVEIGVEDVEGTFADEEAFREAVGE